MAKKKQTTFKFYKVRNVPSPTRSTAESAGIDFYIPYDLTANEMSTKQPVKGLVSITADSRSGIISEYIVPPMARIVIPTGIKVEFPEGKCGMFVDKSTISSKTGLTLLSKLVDADSKEELFINLVNASETPVKMQPGKKIAQLILIDSNIVELEEVNMFGDLNAEIDVPPVVEHVPQAPQLAPADGRLTDEQLREIEAKVDQEFNQFGAMNNGVGY